MDELLKNPETVTLLGTLIGVILVTIFQGVRQGGQIKANKSNIQATQSETSALAQTIREQAGQLAEYKESNEQLHALVKRHEQDAKKREESHQAEIRRIEYANNQNHHQQELKLANQQGRIEELSRQNNTYATSVKEMAEERTRLLTRIEELERQTESIKQSANRQGQELEDVRREKLALEARVAEHTKQIDFLIGENQRLESENVRLQTELQRVQGIRPPKETGILDETVLETLPERPAESVGETGIAADGAATVSEAVS